MDFEVHTTFRQANFPEMGGEEEGRGAQRVDRGAFFLGWSQWTFRWRAARGSKGGRVRIVSWRRGRKGRSREGGASLGPPAKDHPIREIAKSQASYCIEQVMLFGGVNGDHNSQSKGHADPA